jgi:CBS domain-containing protein
MQSTADHTGLSAANGSAFVRASSGAAAVRVGDLATRPIPVVPSHLSMAAARKVALVKQISLLLIERDDHIVGTIDERALAAEHDLTAVAAAMKPLAPYLRPAMPAAEARARFIRAGVDILPVVAGGFILGAVTRSDLETGSH